jgi:hypothetical protein
MATYRQIQEKEFGNLTTSQMSQDHCPTATQFRALIPLSSQGNGKSGNVGELHKLHHSDQAVALEVF